MRHRIGYFEFDPLARHDAYFGPKALHLAQQAARQRMVRLLVIMGGVR